MAVVGSFVGIEASPVRIVSRNSSRPDSDWPPLSPTSNPRRCGAPPEPACVPSRGELGSSAADVQLVGQRRSYRESRHLWLGRVGAGLAQVAYVSRAPTVGGLLGFLLIASLFGAGVAGSQPQGNPDFLFGRPRGSVGVRGGWLFERAGSDLFEFVHEQLTVESDDFDAPTLAFDLGVAAGSRTEAVFGVEFGGTTIRSEYRDFLDNDRLPITQATRLRQANLSGSLKLALTPRGQEIGNVAWVPNAITPYVGAGAGALWYEFHQTGDFVDFLDLSVFSETFRSSGWAPSALVFAGVDVKIARRLFLTGEGRYLWSQAELGPDFSSFEPIDLAGFKLTAGIDYLF